MLLRDDARLLRDKLFGLPLKLDTRLRPKEARLRNENRLPELTLTPEEASGEGPLIESLLREMAATVGPLTDRRPPSTPINAPNVSMASNGMTAADDRFRSLDPRLPRLDRLFRWPLTEVLLLLFSMDSAEYFLTAFFRSSRASALLSSTSVRWESPTMLLPPMLVVLLMLLRLLLPLPLPDCP